MDADNLVNIPLEMCEAPATYHARLAQSKAIPDLTPFPILCARSCFTYEAPVALIVFNILVDCFFILDLYLNFHTAYAPSRPSHHSLPCGGAQIMLQSRLTVSRSWTAASTTALASARSSSRR